MTSEIATDFDFEPLPDGNVLIKFFGDNGVTVHKQVITRDCLAAIPIVVALTDNQGTKPNAPSDAEEIRRLSPSILSPENRTTNTQDAIDCDALHRIPAEEVLYVQRLFYLQTRSPNGVNLDFLPYTSPSKWMVAEMRKKFPNSPWTEKLIYRTLLRIRKLESSFADDVDQHT